MTDNLEELAKQVEGSSMSDKERDGLITHFASFITRSMNEGNSVQSLREQFFLNTPNLMGVSATMLVYIWDEAVQKAERSQNSQWARLSPVLKDSLGAVRSAQELEKWPFKIARATSIGELLRLTLALNDGRIVSMTMEIKELYSQQRFREQFTVATGRILDRIKPRAFDDFISGLEIEETRDTGTSTKDMIQDVLQRLVLKVTQSDTEEEAQESMKSKGMCMRGNILHFKISKLRNEFELKGIKPERLAQSLEDMGAERITKGVWAYKK